jgi:hypothetical protein
MKERYKLLTNIGIFKRWGENEDGVKKDLSSFISSSYGIKGQIYECEKDKTHKYNPEQKDERKETERNTGTKV